MALDLASIVVRHSLRTHLMPHREQNQHWSLESLTKAYQQGYMAGLAGHASHTQPFSANVPAAAWEAGWTDGEGQRRLSEEKLNRPDADGSPSDAKKSA